MTHVNRQVFDELAASLRSYWPGSFGDQQETMASLYEDIADILKANCATFDKQRFLTACGLQVYTYEEQERVRKAAIAVGAKQAVDKALKETLNFPPPRPALNTPVKPGHSATKVIPIHPQPAAHITNSDEDRVAIAQQERILDMLDPPREEEDGDWGWVFDADGNERPMTKAEWDEQRARDIADGWVNPWYIRATEQANYGLFWSNEDGWVGIAQATRFLTNEKATLRLPMGGEWFRLEEVQRLERVRDLEMRRRKRNDPHGQR